MEKTAYVLRPSGTLIVMLLNPQSAFYKQKFQDPGLYVQKIRHMNLQEIESTVAERFSIRAEYFMGARNDNIYKSKVAHEACSYVMRGTRRC